jgi:hypothetical protein
MPQSSPLTPLPGASPNHDSQSLEPESPIRPRRQAAPPTQQPKSGKPTTDRHFTFSNNYASEIYGDDAPSRLRSNNFKPTLASAKATLKFPDTSARGNRGGYAVAGIIQSSPSIELEPNKRRIGTRCEYVEVDEDDGLYSADGASQNQPHPIQARHELLESPCVEKARRTGEAEVIDLDNSPPANQRKPQDSRKTADRASLLFMDSAEPSRKGNKRHNDAEPAQDKRNGKGRDAEPRNGRKGKGRDNAEPRKDNKGKGRVNISFIDTDDELLVPKDNGTGTGNRRDDAEPAQDKRNGKGRDNAEPRKDNKGKGRINVSFVDADDEPPVPKGNGTGDRRDDAEPSWDKRKDKTQADARDKVAQRGRGQYAKS